MITEDKLIAMLAMQDQLNTKINPDWLKAGYPWHRAIMVEGVEALEHYGWKWWKEQAPDLAQARIELVDIWHFIMSMSLTGAGGDAAQAADSLATRFAASESRGAQAAFATASKLEALIGYAAQGRINSDAFVGLMKDFGLSWDGLYTIYVGKNVLNMFRQDNGYKTGTYVKTWDGVEDNVALDQLLALRPDATPDQLYAKLKSVYAKVTAPTPA